MNALFEVPLERIDGTPTALREFSGKVLLVVNVASKCGFTPQYAGLEALFESQRERGLVVLGFPANDFGAQEPGENADIATFCSTTYGVTFPMFAKVSVTGAGTHPLYRELLAAQPSAIQKPGSTFRAELAGYGVIPEHPTDVLWNFEKFLIARDGRVVARFAPDVEPDDPRFLAAIDRELRPLGELGSS